MAAQHIPAENEQIKIYGQCNSDRLVANRNRIAMLRIRVEFKEAEIFHDEILTFVDCQHIQPLDNLRMLLVVSPRITINVKFSNVKHLSPITL